MTLCAKASSACFPAVVMTMQGWWKKGCDSSFILLLLSSCCFFYIMIYLFIHLFFILTGEEGEMEKEKKDCHIDVGQLI